MRVLLVNKFHYMKGGAETYYFALADSLRRLGHQVAFFSMRHPLNFPCENEGFFVKRREYDGHEGLLSAGRDGLALIYSLEARAKFDALLREFQPDVVHLNNVHRQISLSILDAKALGDVPIAYTAHDYVTVCPSYVMLDGSGAVCEACLGGRFHHCLEKRCVKGSRTKSGLAVLEAEFLKLHHSYERINKVIAPSAFMRSKLIEGGWPEHKVNTMQNFASRELLEKSKPIVSYQSKAEDPYLLFFGRLSKEKGVDHLIEAFLAVAERIPSTWRMVVAGDGAEKMVLEQLLRGRKGGARVAFVGHQSGTRLQRLVSSAAYAVVPSRWRENMPYSIIESFAAGTPVIATDIGGISELVMERETGFSCLAQDTESLAGAILRAVDMFYRENDYLTMQSRCCDYIDEHCSQDQYMHRLVALYEGMINA